MEIQGADLIKEDIGAYLKRHEEKDMLRFLCAGSVDDGKSTLIEALFYPWHGDTPLPLGDKDATVYPSWSPNKQIIAMYSEGKNFDQQYLYFLGLNNENFKSSVIAGRSFEGVWSPKGDRLFYSVYTSQDDFKPSLWVVSAQGENIGQNRKNLNLQTWADKCSFTDNDTIYCAVPQSLEDGAGIFRDEFDSSPSDIYKIHLKIGSRSRVAIPEGRHNIESLMVSGDGQNLYFVSKNDGRIYQVQLR